MGWDRMGWDGIKWDGIGWDSMGWCGIGSDRDERWGWGRMAWVGTGAEAVLVLLLFAVAACSAYTADIKACDTTHLFPCVLCEPDIC